MLSVPRENTQNQTAMEPSGETRVTGAGSWLLYRNDWKLLSVEFYKFSLFVENTTQNRDEAFRVGMGKNQTLLP